MLMKINHSDEAVERISLTFFIKKSSLVLNSRDLVLAISSTFSFMPAIFAT
jgi:hypothetical protein